MAKQPAHPSGRVVSVRLAPDIEKRLNDLAERTGRSRGFYLRLALEAMLPELEKDHWNQAAKEYEDNLFMDRFREITAALMASADDEREDQPGGGGAPGNPL